MPTLRRGGREGNLAARPGRPEILLTSESPYGGRRLVVEYDGSTTAAYVYDQTAVVGAVWLAHHPPAPAAAHPAPGPAGPAPRMPAARRHPPPRPAPPRPPAAGGGGARAGGGPPPPPPPPRPPPPLDPQILRPL